MTLTKQLTLPVIFSGIILSSTMLFAAPNHEVATVNGKVITEEQLEIAASQSKIKLAEMNAQQRKALIEALVNRNLVLQEAIKAGFDKKPDVVARLQAISDSYIAANYLADLAENFKIEEVDVKAYYDTKVATNTPEEYKARHILVKTEDEANEIIKQLQDGGDFSALAKEKSTDTVSGANGGDLGWFSATAMIAPFSKAVSELNKGELSKKPVNTQFGWHVIILDDERQAKAPEYDQVKENIEKVLLKEKLNEYLKEINEKAKIEIK